MRPGDQPDSTGCRVCLSTDSQHYESLHTDDMFPLLLKLLGPECGAIHLLPSHVCSHCKEQLLLFDTFRRDALINAEFVSSNQNYIEQFGLDKAKQVFFSKENSEVEFKQEMEGVSETEATEDNTDEKENNLKITFYEKKDVDTWDDDNPVSPLDLYFAESDGEEEHTNNISSVNLTQGGKRRRKGGKPVPGFCNICQKEYASISGHDRTFHRRTAEKCSVCGKIFTGRHLLRAHMSVHTAPMLPCPQCGKFIKKTSLQKHIMYSHKKSDIECTYPDCKKLFRQPQTLKFHIKRVHLGETKLCPDCGQAVKDLYNHRVVCCPDNIDLITCKICQKIFSTSSSRIIHEKTMHGNIGPTICNICGKSVKHLESHVKNTHSQNIIKRFLCTADGCTKTFKTKQELTAHTDGVHLSKREQCGECGQWYSVKHLKTHIQNAHSETGGTRYPCFECNKEFSRASEVKIHRERVHEGKRYICPECGKTVSKVGEHMKAVHGICNVDRSQLTVTYCDKPS